MSGTAPLSVYLLLCQALLSCLSTYYYVRHCSPVCLPIIMSGTAPLSVYLLLCQALLPCLSTYYYVRHCSPVCLPIIMSGTAPLSVYLLLCQALLPCLSTYYYVRHCSPVCLPIIMSQHVHDKISQTFSLRFCILQVMKQCSWGRPGNEVVMSLHLHCRFGGNLTVGP